MLLFTVWVSTRGFTGEFTRHGSYECTIPPHGPEDAEGENDKSKDGCVRIAQFS